MCPKEDNGAAAEWQWYAGPIPRFFGAVEPVTRSRPSGLTSKKHLTALMKEDARADTCVRTVLADDQRGSVRQVVIRVGGLGDPGTRMALPRYTSVVHDLHISSGVDSEDFFGVLNDDC